jgi:hypothetical protein
LPCHGAEWRLWAGERQQSFRGSIPKPELGNEK